MAAFRNSFRDLIAFVGHTWENIEASWARGIETSAQARVTHNILITGTYMCLYTDITASTTPDSSDTGIGEPLVRRPRNSGSALIAATPKRWSLVVGGSFVGERQDADFTFGVTRNPGYENILRQRFLRHRQALHADSQSRQSAQRDAIRKCWVSRRFRAAVLGGVRIHW